MTPVVGMNGDRDAEVTYLWGLSRGWSVTIILSNTVSPACSTALIKSGVRSCSVISALSLMTVAHEGSFELSFWTVKDIS